MRTGCNRRGKGAGAWRGARCCDRGRRVRRRRGRHRGVTPASPRCGSSLWAVRPLRPRGGAAPLAGLGCRRDPGVHRGRGAKSARAGARRDGRRAAVGPPRRWHTRAFDDHVAWLVTHCSKSAGVELMRILDPSGTEPTTPTAQAHYHSRARARSGSQHRAWRAQAADPPPSSDCSHGTAKHEGPRSRGPGQPGADHGDQARTSAFALGYALPAWTASWGLRWR